MQRPMQMDKPSNPLGVAFTLGELQRVIAHAIAVHGSTTGIHGYHGPVGISLNAHFPSGMLPHIMITEVARSMKLF